MWSAKDVYYISDSTGILVTNLGQALICQFPEINFNEEKIPFVRTVDEARQTMDYIMKRSGGRRPLLFTTILDPEVRAVFDTPDVEFFEAYGLMLERLESCLEARGVREPGFARHITDMAMAKRVEAIHFSLEHDDGMRLEEYDEAEIILLGVSRAGKTPVSVFLATQMGLKAANFPLTSEYFGGSRLPLAVRNNVKRVVGLTTSSDILHSIREKRYPGSTYAKQSTCIEEIQQAQEMFQRYQIPVVSTAGKSIEETATQILQLLGLSKKPGSPAKPAGM
jgi:hypothetical protein